MKDRVEFEMTEAEYAEILEACRPVPWIMVGGVVPPSALENANAAWQRLGERRGFDGMTVLPGRSRLHFTAIPTADPTP
jgi:hypothetical protein